MKVFTIGSSARSGQIQAVFDYHQQSRQHDVHSILASLQAGELSFPVENGNHQWPMVGVPATYK
jgi:hypothetical protein